MHEISRAVDGVDDPRGRIRELYLRTARDGFFADESEKLLHLSSFFSDLEELYMKTK